MTDFIELAKGIASQLDGNFRSDLDSGSRAYVDLQHEREGLTVSLSRGYGSEASRIRASIYPASSERIAGDYHDREGFRTLDTAAAMSRGPAVIARQVEAKIVQPALAKLETLRGRVAAHKQAISDLDAAQARWEAKNIPGLKIWARPENEGVHRDLSWSGAGIGYLSGRLYGDGRLHIDRSSSIPEDAAAALLMALAINAK